MNIQQQIKRGDFDADFNLINFRAALEKAFPTSKFSQQLKDAIYEKTYGLAAGEDLTFFVQEYSSMIDLVLMAKMEK